MSYTDALGREKEGNLIEIEGLPYCLSEPWTLDELKAALENQDEKVPLRCRVRLHAWEVVANYEPLPPGIAPNLAVHTVGLMKHLGTVSVCKRCKRGRREFS